MKKQNFILKLGLISFLCLTKCPLCMGYNYYDNYYHYPNYTSEYKSPYFYVQPRPKIQPPPPQIRLQKIKKTKKKHKNNIVWLNNSTGKLSGYSLPVKNNSIKNFSFDNSTTSFCNTELWKKGANNSSKTGNFMSNRQYSNDRQTGAKTGITIIYD